MAGSGRAKSCFLPGLKTCARPCDCCSAEAALFFCRPDASFMCLACDAWVHGGGDCAAAAHERVWICDVCGQAPASVTCKADAAALCATCDRDIHSANPLARRHEREAVVPLLAAFSSSLLPPPSENGDLDCPIPDSWIFPADDPASRKPELLFSDCDQFLDFDSYQISQSQPFNDSLVPVQENLFEIDFTTSNKINFHSSSFNTSPLSHSVSSSSLDVGTVPDGSGASETSYTFSRSLSSIDRTASQVSPAVGMDREARVLRYKEKRKNRKFEKTIRYASRKAYAERRPRIKGRFAKKTDSEQDMYSIFRASTGGHFTVPMT